MSLKFLVSANLYDHLSFPVCLGRNPCVMFEISAEVGLVREMHVVGNLLYAHVRECQVQFDLTDYVRVNGLFRTFSRYFFRDIGQIPCRDAQLVSIPCHVPVLSPSFVDHVYESVVYFFLTRMSCDFS